MTPDNFLTLRDLLRYAVTCFQRAKLYFGHGSNNAYDEAAYLLLHTLQLPLDKLEPFLDARLLPHEVAACLAIIQKRATERLPAAYLTNEAWLGGYHFYVDPRVIVPRSFIAELIPEQFSPWVENPEEVTRILELCTGSGCLSIMLADAFPYAQIDAIDICADALAVAKRNVADYGLESRIKLIQSDLYSALPAQYYNLIITNPPYVTTQSLSQLPDEYRFEPQIALAGGKDGMELVRKIVTGAAQYLQPQGCLIVEIGNEALYAQAAFPEKPLTWLATSGGDDKIFLLTKEEC